MVKMDIVQKSRKLYGIDDWGGGYFSLSTSGSVKVSPFGKNSESSITIDNILEKAMKLNVKTPLLLRFPQILENQIRFLYSAFQNAIDEFHYKGHLKGVFPFKVNQRKEFISDVVECGDQYAYGLEVGTKTELFAALAFKLHENALIVCNGFKDSQYIELAFDAKKMGKNVILVIEGTDELKFIINYAKKVGFCIDIGFRAKLYAKGSGMWEKSGGIGSKFGLNSVEMLEALELIKEADFQDYLTMLHYHIGSQITEIKHVKSAMQEAARVYAKISKNGFNLQFLNIGGGIGVDYDGSNTSFYVSRNYTLQEFANDVVYIIQEVCRAENCKEPNIVTESGRVVAAYHAVLITDVREVEKMGGDLEDWKVDNSDHNTLQNLEYSCTQINAKNFVEYYHDALAYRDELFTLFNLGYLGIEERTKTEVLFNEVCQQSLDFYRQSNLQLEEFDELEKGQIRKYLANFSIFQSIPDTITIDQLFPIMPIARLDEQTESHGVIMDLTCDSDGCLDRFVDKKDVKPSLPLHQLKNHQPYHIGFFLVGAYQEALGNNHNLFGAVNELIIRLDEEGQISYLEEVKGEDCGDMLRTMNYQDEEIISGYEKQLKQALDSKKITLDDYCYILKKVKLFFFEYPYLLPKNSLEIVE